METDHDALDEAILEHLLGDRTLPEEDLQDPETAARIDQLEQVLAMVDQAPVPARGEDYGAQVWQRLESRLPSQVESSPGPPAAANGPNHSAGLRRFMQLAAAVLLVILGFAVGRWQSPGSEQVVVTDPPPAGSLTIDGEARERLLLAAMGEHLGRTERLLTEVSNASTSTPPTSDLADWSEQAWAEELLRTNRIYRMAALRAGQLRIAALLAELEPIFLELANGPAPVELNDLQRRVDDNSLLFKVRVTEGRLKSPRSGTT